MITTSLRALSNNKAYEVEVSTSGTETMGPKVKSRGIATTKTKAQGRGIEEEMNEHASLDVV
jgi:hypothetical protein